MKHKLTQKKDGKMKSVKMLVPYLFAVLLLFAVNGAASVFVEPHGFLCGSTRWRALQVALEV